LKATQSIQSNVLPRIKALEKRIDTFAIDIAKEREYLEKRYE
jgi:hypothetical protein